MARKSRPTEDQLEYARDLGIRVDPEVTRNELSQLIDEALARKYPPSQGNLQSAADFGITIEGPIDKRKLFWLIWNEIDKYGREEDLAAWFVYRICRGCAQGGPDPKGAEGVNAPALREIARELARDPKVMRSIRRYEPRKLIWFGRWTTPDGVELEGGSKRTAAFKAAAQLIEQRLGLTHRNQRARQAGASAGSGCVLCFAPTLLAVWAIGALLWQLS